MDPLVILAAVAVLAVAVIVFRRRAPADHNHGSEPMRTRRAQPMSRPLSTGTPRDLGTMASTSGRGGAVFPFVATEGSNATAEMPVPRDSFPLSNAPRGETPEVSTRQPSAQDRRDSSRVQDGRVEYYRPSPNDGTLQFVPGRLEVLEGDELRHEIRFVRTIGEKPDITFGRNSGEPYRHIQLHSRTVSRLHARMTWENDAWFLTNLSGTNPTVLNQQPLEGTDAATKLNDGDRIEMGEVVFRFRDR